ncbi:MAG: cellulase family glycosylhydrolase [Pseudomonadota bacterium]
MTNAESIFADLDINLRSSWSSGLVADLTLTAEQQLTGWTIEIEYDGDIVNIWNARIISRIGNRYVIESLAYNGSVAEGATTGFGFQGNGSSTQITPITINGAAFGQDSTDPTPAPMVSVTDAIASEDDGSITFTLTLSTAATEDIVVNYQTLAGSAVVSSDFVAADAQVVIGAGQTSANVTIQLVNDVAPETTEAFQLQLLSAQGAEIADGVATGTITDAEVAPPPADPVVSLSNTSAIEGDPGGAMTTPSPAGSLIADGPLSTAGNQIVDVNGNAVQIRAVNWFGAENDVRAPHGLWQRPMTDMMDQMLAEGFNAIRLPFSVENILDNQVATSVGGDPSLAGLTTLEIFDRIVAYAEDIGIKIILDAHRITQGNGAEGIWYSGAFDEQDWIDAWQLLGNRYGDSSAVIGADLLNEPHLGTWGTGARNDWATAAELAGNAVLDVAPNWLILVEGIGNYNGNNYWWGGAASGCA